MQLWETKHVPGFAKMEILKMIKGEKNIDERVVGSIEEYRADIEADWPKELKEFVFKKIKEIKEN